MDKFRKGYMMLAEMINVFRIIPRALIVGYSFMLYKVVDWYMNLTPYILEGCKSETVVDCIVQSPSNQHAALVTAVVGISAAVFGLYTRSGSKVEPPTSEQ